jgi:2-polyprenyl-3-methyl-5-hydroxy-6-metoxy-1,4-benzoquinol methylase
MSDNAVPQLTEGLRSISNEIDALSTQIETGEPQPQSVTLRGRIGLLAKRRLGRLLWWQNHQIKVLTGLMKRYTHEETRAFELLSQSIVHSTEQIRHIHQVVEAASQNLKYLNQQVQETHHMVFECRQQVRNSESRLQQVESQQVSFQARYDGQLEAATASLRRDLSEVRDALGVVEARIAERILHENAASTHRIGEVAQQVEVETASLSTLAQRVEAETGRLSALAQQIDSETPQKEQMAARLSELGLFAHQTRATLSIQERRLAVFIEEARKRLPKPFANEQLQAIADNHADHKYDSLYVAFEDAFRGSRDDIKARQSVYLPWLKERSIGSPEMPILDLGCGRGEWLELLREHGLQALGLDCNELMIDYCKGAGLDVIQDDALSYLGTLPEACMGAVTSFHMVEHLTFEAVLALVDEVLRILKPGGMVVFETPNPGNLLVGAHTFHLDPTHLKPLPSSMLRFFVEARGFCDVQVLELNPCPETERLPDDGAVASRMNAYLYGPQDYAVIGRKP